MAAGGGARGEDGVGGLGVADASCYTGWTSNKVLLCRPGRQSQYPVMNFAVGKNVQICIECVVLVVSGSAARGLQLLKLLCHGILRRGLGSHALLQSFPTQGSNLLSSSQADSLQSEPREGPTYVGMY